MKDPHNLGSFETLEKVWDIYPHGGCPGDFVIVDNILIYWNDERRVWGEAGDIISSDTSQRVEGNLIVDKNLVVGGSIKGNIAIFKKLIIESLEVSDPPYALKAHNHDELYAAKNHTHQLKDIIDYDDNVSSNESHVELSRDIHVTVSKAGNYKSGDIIPMGTMFEDIFLNMLSQEASARLEGKISTANDVEFGTKKGYLTYTSTRNSQGPIKQAYYDDDPFNVLSFSKEVNKVQTASRELDGTYTQSETYTATVVYAASENKILPELSLYNKISVNVRRKWFAGVCNSIPQSSSEVRALGSNGIYKGPGTYQFPIGQWLMFAVCIPADTISELTLTAYPGNFIEDGAKGPFDIMVEGANGAEAINYKMWIAESIMMNDADTFTFKTV